MNKRKPLILTATMLLVLALVLAACSSSKGKEQNAADSAQPAAATADTKTDGSEGGAAVQGGTLSYALATSPDTLDPHRSGLAVAVRVLRTIYDSLVVQLPDNSIKPWLATSWTVSDDGKSYTFKLRQDVKFQDGTPFNAEAVKYSYDRILDPATKAANAVALLAPYESSEIIDDYTIKLNLSTPSRAFLGNLSQALLGIVSPTAAKKDGDQFGLNPVGTGPFKFVKWEQNAEIQVERNPDYNWAPETVENKGAPYLDGITFKIIPEEATRIGSVQSGQVLAAETVPPQNIVALKDDKKTQLLQANTVGLPYTLFFNEERPPWNEAKARQAVQLAIDVDSIVKTLYLGTYDRAWSPLTPGTFGYDPSLENSVKPDLTKANALLDELGWVKGADGIREKDGKKLTIHYVDGTPNREKRNDIAVIIQQQLKAIGISVEVEITKDVRTVVFTNGAYDLYGNSQVNSDPNALYSFYHTAKPNGTPTLPRLSDPDVDKLLEQGLVETDDTKRAEIYKQIQHYIIDQAVVLPIYVFPYTVAADRSVQGIVFDTLGYPIFNSASIKK
ncbi:peptide/nickel transport system substrate-binding protein [Paenibacillus cellulosilyticus]|uniref:Peptide/nickel transport system substrate-binding protein n=1 Tax=Paenibacillus cellulosilyticus TaxID=375489 RepID=A0A2V2YNL1_9BACL|nr:ABC transporter substrate-binding protein [Paenibacillus cellulosilyticus]PWV97317.1 peptide/nickel transport system substrate-binding protein [Paenibacillus cellulosilyticus]QKS47483.1 ABC transporter substrate-binding protein [Paenibacillus cellulosilyticus]